MISERSTELVGLHRPQPGRRKPSIAWLAPVVFLQFFCYLGPTAFLQEDFQNRHGASAVELWTFALGLRGFLSFFTSPGIGALSDHWGRKPMLGLQVLAMTAPGVPLAIMPSSSWSIDIAVALTALVGFTGSLLAPSFAYCTDLAPAGEANKVQALIARMLAASFSPSFILAPTMCKYLFAFLGKRLSWAVVVGVGILNTLYIWILLPESHNASECGLAEGESQKRQGVLERPPDLSRNPLRYFRLLKCSSPEGWQSARLLRLISGVIFFLYTAKMTVISTIVLFAEERFGWSPGNAGMLLSMWGLMQFLSMTIIGAVGKLFDERIISWIGLVSGFLGMLVLFFTVRGWMLVLGMAIGAVSMISLTALSGYAVCLVRTSMHGEVQGLITTMICLTEVFGPPVFGTLMSFALGQSNVPWWVLNLPFALGVLCVLVAMLFMLSLPRRSQAMRLCGCTLDQQP